MSYCIGYAYFLNMYEIPDYRKLTPALDAIYGEEKVEWDIRGQSLVMVSESQDLVGLRDKLRMVGVTPTWEEYCYNVLD
ncbi:hypothetical protein FPSE_05988 [Fusarium pseudograminearum CS3096]|uniref:Uncharacterized protein n=1 Tax=Fusarium pseudograminearum (strain CS3096) TaxID=1028729 RepID=K3W0B6_FUSPC|nr:hypothetical protein FPSE_05988 [Fusarium pseudograminearum CS3096]EKJ73865.1 hypothetical protein FPSE_05988 [Fusarium pseudograminearum CS3096]